MDAVVGQLNNVGWLGWRCFCDTSSDLVPTLVSTPSHAPGRSQFVWPHPGLPRIPDNESQFLQVRRLDQPSALPDS